VLSSSVPFLRSLLRACELPPFRRSRSVKSMPTHESTPDHAPDLPVESVEFHDANLSSFSISLTKRTAAFGLALPRTEARRERKPVHLLGDAIESLFARVDMPILSNHAWAGNIQYGRFYPETSTMRLVLVGGVVEASSTRPPFRLAPRSAEAPLPYPEREAIAGTLEELDEVELHLSILCSVHVCMETRACEVELLIRREGSLVEFDTAVLRFSDVSACLLKVDRSALAGNFDIGNIHSCHTDHDRGLVWLNLRDGFIEVAAGGISLARRPAQTSVESWVAPAQAEGGGHGAS
jgi:hypothetical protein